MVDIDLVIDQICSLGDLSGVSEECIVRAAEDSTAVVLCELKKAEHAKLPVVIRYISAKAFFTISLAEEIKGGVSSFTAGDITLKYASSVTNYAKQQMIEAKNDCRAFLRDDMFAFLGV